MVEFAPVQVFLGKNYAGHPPVFRAILKLKKFFYIRGWFMWGRIFVVMEYERHIIALLPRG